MTEEFDHVSQLMQEPLPDEPEALILALENIEVWNARMQFLLAEANSFLKTEKAANLPHKEGVTDFDRRIMLEAKISQVEEKRDKIKGICESIETRIILGESILGYFKQTRNHTIQTEQKLLRKILGENQ